MRSTARPHCVATRGIEADPPSHYHKAQRMRAISKTCERLDPEAQATDSPEQRYG
jgi:hypothetical protein